MRGVFVTGTDTGVGKTLVATALVGLLAGRGLRVAAMKPVASGCRRSPGGLRNADAEALIAASGRDLPYEDVNPWAWEPPIAPHLAAAEAGQEIRFAPVLEAYRRLIRDAEVVVVEGVGGWAVPLGPEGDVGDLAVALGLPVLEVVGLRLGCINHAVLTRRAIARRGAPWAGWVACSLEAGLDRERAQIEDLARRLPGPFLGHVPFLQPAIPGRAAAFLTPLAAALAAPGCARFHTSRPAEGHLDPKKSL